jgi:selenocysteine lyase/cysteine desulfurase
LTIYGPANVERQVGVVSVRLDHWEPMDVGVALDQDYDIAVRTGLHCAPAAHRTIGTFPTGTVRLSPGYFTTSGDVDRAIAALDQLAVRWQRGSPEFH